MSDEDNFLSRWSRRKREVAKSEQGESLPAVPPAARESSPDAAQASPGSQEPAFDLSKLPSLESISANTDISAFMQAGVPASLRHAALRRAWAADPAIRDFIGPADYAWDFTDPGAMQGFGALDPAVDVNKLAGNLFRDAMEPRDSIERHIASAPENTAPPAWAQNAERSSKFETDEPEMLQREDDLASQQNEAPAAPLPRTARKHGGAMPQ